jgi:RimJ/RimL family protein N-acetyltransferase
MMFARTTRLLLRPGFIEDAPELTRIIADEAIARNLARLPWPYGLTDAQWWLNREAVPLLPNFLILQRTGGVPRIVGGIGLHLLDDAPRTANGRPRPEIGYWVARSHWGLGIATEAGRAVMRIAHALGHPPLVSGHFIDNPASGAVLRKLGFRATGRIAARHSLARGHDVPCALYEEAADEDAGGMTGKRTPVSPDEDFRGELRLMAA